MSLIIPEQVSLWIIWIIEISDVFLNTDLALGSRLECEVGEHEGGVDGEDGGARLLRVGEDRVRGPVEGLEPLHPAVKHLQQTTALML